MLRCHWERISYAINVSTKFLNKIVVLYLKLIISIAHAGHGMIAMIYETCLKHMVPINIAIGDKVLGKSCATKCMLALTGRSQVLP